MERLVVLLVIALAVPSAAAQTLYRCPGQGANGATLIQDRPCPDGREAATKLDSREIWVSPHRQRDIAVMQQERTRRAEQARSLGQWSPNTQHRAPTEAQRRRQACQDAKNWRDAQRRARGLDRTYEWLSSLDKHVKAQCKGVGP